MQYRVCNVDMRECLTTTGDAGPDVWVGFPVQLSVWCIQNQCFCVYFQYLHESSHHSQFVLISETLIKVFANGDFSYSIHYFNFVTCLQDRCHFHCHSVQRRQVQRWALHPSTMQIASLLAAPGWRLIICEFCRLHTMARLA